MIPDTNKDVIEARVEEFYAELKSRGIGVGDPADTNDIIAELQSRGYEVFKKA